MDEVCNLPCFGCDETKTSRIGSHLATPKHENPVYYHAQKLCLQNFDKLLLFTSVGCRIVNLYDLKFLYFFCLLNCCRIKCCSNADSTQQVRETNVFRLLPSQRAV